MADKKPIRGPDIYIGGKPRKKSSWEAKELGDINRYWKREPTSREGQRQSSIHRTMGKQPQRKRSQKA